MFMDSQLGKSVLKAFSLAIENPRGGFGEQIRRVMQGRSPAGGLPCSSPNVPHPDPALVPTPLLWWCFVAKSEWFLREFKKKKSLEDTINPSDVSTLTTNSV